MKLFWALQPRSDALWVIYKLKYDLIPLKVKATLATEKFRRITVGNELHVNKTEVKTWMRYNPLLTSANLPPNVHTPFYLLHFQRVSAVVLCGNKGEKELQVKGRVCARNRIRSRKSRYMLYIETSWCHVWVSAGGGIVRSELWVRQQNMDSQRTWYRPFNFFFF